MDTSLFDFELPERLIAQQPAERRDASRLLVVDRAAGSVSHHVFSELPELLPYPLRVFRNSASVLKARLHGLRAGGGRAECLLLRPADTGPDEWWCLLKPGRKLREGATFGLDGVYQATVVEKRPDGENRVRFRVAGGGNVFDLADNLGQMPLPPYIRRGEDDPLAAMDGERYQTTYADPGKVVAAAAPTAGLHFTPAINASLGERGATFHEVILHVGLGTFKPIESETVEAHDIHTEFYEIPAATLDALQSPATAPRLCIGTTTVRTLEDYRRRHPGPAAAAHAAAFTAEADIFLYPPAQFAATDMLLTNFHLPRSTLLCLVSAFLTPGKTDGIRWLKEIYAEAIARDYRFFSYGDAMLIR